MNSILEKYKSRKLYIITTADNWPVKVGVSHSPEKRLKALQGASWKELRIFALFECSETTVATYRLESKIHNEFKYKQLSGEWFDIKAEEAKSAIEYEIMCEQS